MKISLNVKTHVFSQVIYMINKILIQLLAFNSWSCLHFSCKASIQQHSETMTPEGAAAYQLGNVIFLKITKLKQC